MLTPAEKSFLRSQGLAEADVYDARNQSTSYWKRRVREAGKTVVLGSPCSKEGHRLRSRSGHCVQCDTKKLAYQKRYHSDGYVYIAGSLSAKVLKIGTAINVDQRERNLCGHNYANISDWKIIFHVAVADAGEVEQRALRSLEFFRQGRTYEKDGRVQVAGEVIDARLARVASAVVDAIGDAPTKNAWRSVNWKKYDFPKK